MIFNGGRNVCENPELVEHRPRFREKMKVGKICLFYEDNRFHRTNWERKDWGCPHESVSADLIFFDGN